MMGLCWLIFRKFALTENNPIGYALIYYEKNHRNPIHSSRIGISNLMRGR